MRQRRHPEQGYRSCLGVIILAKTFGHDRLDAACVRALERSLWKAAIGPGHRSGAIGPGPSVRGPWRTPIPTHHCIPVSKMVWIAKLAPASRPLGSMRSHAPAG
jgi:hypothetical protein